MRGRGPHSCSACGLTAPSHCGHCVLCRGISMLDETCAMAPVPVLRPKPGEDGAAFRDRTVRAVGWIRNVAIALPRPVEVRFPE